jgi:hypothetical protein
MGRFEEGHGVGTCFGVIKVRRMTGEHKVRPYIGLFCKECTGLRVRPFATVGGVEMKPLIVM